MIDPQLQATKWIKNVLAESKLKILKFMMPGFSQDMKGSIKNGLPVLVEDVELSLPPILDQILSKDISNEEGINMVKFGDEFINIDNQFNMFLATKIPNPNYLPEIFNKVNVINFTVTEFGLEEQILAMVVRNEREEV